MITAHAPPPDLQVLGSLYSSGSSGAPVKVPQTNVSQHWFRACHLRDLAWAGWDLRKRLATIKFQFDRDSEHTVSKSQKSYPHWDSWINQIFVTGQSYTLPIDIDPEDQYEWLRIHKPDYLVTYPSNLEALLDIAEVRGPLKLESVKTLSEPLSTELRSRAEQYFSLRDTYSSQELGYIASECEQGSLCTFIRRLIWWKCSMIMEILVSRVRQGEW